MGRRIKKGRKQGRGNVIMETKEQEVIKVWEEWKGLGTFKY